MRRILVLGSSGSGKTTFARSVGDQLGLEVIHLDSHYWRPNWVEPSQDTWEQTLVSLLKKENWVMDGNYTSSLPLRLSYADTVIFLDFGRLHCLWRVVGRYRRYKGGNRPELPPGCNEKIDRDFIKWIWDYPRRSRSRIMAVLADSDVKNQIFLKGPKEVGVYLDKLSIA